MPNYNKLVLIGHLCRDLELRASQAGKSFAKGAIAVNDSYTKEVCFIDFTAFGQRAEVMSKHLGKGDPVLLEGRIQQEKWEDKEGNNRSKHSMVVDSFAFVGGKERAPKRDAESSEKVPF